MYTYFTLNENLKETIKRTLPNEEIIEANQISTGWTNIVYNVKTDAGEYFFRFPRDDFWARTIVKDCEFAQYIRGKTDFNTVNLSLQHDNNGRPFSIHRKIEGNVLADKMDNLTIEEVKNISNDIAKFMYQLHQIRYNENEIFNINNIGLKLSSFLDELLTLHVSEQDRKFWRFKDEDAKECNCLVHGDLNSSNVLLDENNNVTAFIDFGFGGFGNKYSDIARIIGRTPEKFKNEIVRSYEKFENQTLNMQILDQEIDIWNKIDSGYINYMRGIGIYE